MAGAKREPPGKFHPFDLDTFGLGAVLHAAAKKGARRCLVGIGGSATNDAGFGVARAAGWQFLDKHGASIESWTELHRLARLVPLKRRLFRELIVAVDVQNPLLDARGCSRIYGPQKGLRPEDMISSERNLRRLADVFARETGRDFHNEPGAGAAGGLGFGLRSFLGARLAPGFDLFAKHAQLEKHLRSTDLIITGEGSLDKSTLMGKGVGEIARRAKKTKLPCIGLGGGVNDRAQVRKLFTQAHALAPDLASVDEAKARPAFWLEQLAARVAADWR
ncbi:MAG: glycerate kinase [Verrucomicrobia bacterium]|nr:glycerate kinase [Verrucomicrobiota bacterium]